MLGNPFVTLLLIIIIVCSLAGIMVTAMHKKAVKVGKARKLAIRNLWKVAIMKGVEEDVIVRLAALSDIHFSEAEVNDLFKTLREEIKQETGSIASEH